MLVRRGRDFVWFEKTQSQIEIRGSKTYACKGRPYYAQTGFVGLVGKKDNKMRWDSNTVATTDKSMNYGELMIEMMIQSGGKV